MGRKRRSHDSNADASGDSTASSDNNAMNQTDCPHFNKSISIPKIRKNVKDKKYDVCQDCQKENFNNDMDKDDDDSEKEESLNLWLCLQCGHIACGRNNQSHSLKHSTKAMSDPHHVVINLQNWGIWCYKCDEYLHLKKKQKENIEQIKSIIKLTKPVVQKPELPVLCQNNVSTDNGNNKTVNSIPKVGGLVNLGNTCFFNSVLQCLAQTPYLVKVLEDLLEPDQTFVLPGGKCKTNDNEEIELPPIEGKLDNNFTFTPVLLKTLTDMQQGEGQVYRPSELLNALRRKTMQCTDGGQHDAHELLRHLLECVRNEDVKRYKAVILEDAGLKGRVTSLDTVEDSKKAQVKFYGIQAMAKLLGAERAFRGELVSTLQCQKCNYTSIRTEPFLDLSLPVQITEKKIVVSHLKRKSSNLDNSYDSMGNKSSASLTTGDKGNESEDSDADVEDNVENEDLSMPEIGESGYSSEKASALTSPASPGDHLLTDQNINNVESNNLCAENNMSTSSLDLVNLNDNNLNISPSSTDVQMTDLSSDNRNNGIECSSRSTSSQLLSDSTSPEGTTVRPFNSPVSNVDSSSSPISRNVDDKQVSSDKEDSEKKTNLNALNDDSSTKKKYTRPQRSNGLGDVTSNLIKLDLSNVLDSSSRYQVNEGECSVKSCLNQFTDQELMTDNNKVMCDACTERENKGKKEGVKMVCQDSTKQYLVSRVPAILILHLKRFQMTKFSFRKLNKHVSFPLVFDLAPASKDSTPKMYALYGVVEHSGTLYGGHYVSYVKSRAPLTRDDPRWSFLPNRDSFESKQSSNISSDVDSDDSSTNEKDPANVEPPYGRWYYISDSRVTEVDEKTVLNSEAYLLFYERIL
ncbi:ubiquitin carboxyl-terminal hydrolase 45 isoform X2 [Trichogramma pretiosum]|uniref:ubiquitin carboxyl-terminal hydrolase 45 isoform X2 n=1 Tax=Trichogramma pretiosum TaxID=7493 RepID=UPI0006C9D127|nr:ubiquitin carboxyl-terminal hydrolase 45 isoform X2 [Trichogramma pretiosum]